MTNNKKCNYVMDKFLELDKNEKIPFWMTRHFLTCEECRSNVRMFTQAEKMLHKEENQQNPFGYATLMEVKEKLYPGSTKPKRVPVLYWIVIGIVLLLCMILCTILSKEATPLIQCYSFIFVAASITTYIMLFIGFNLDFFIKQ